MIRYLQQSDGKLSRVTIEECLQTVIGGVSISRSLVCLASYPTPVAAEHLIGEYVALTQYSSLNMVSPLMGQYEEQLFARERRM